jgi:transcription antitermination factor NusG
MDETTNTGKKWFAIYTRHKFESKVTQKIAELDMEAYCPLIMVERQWSDRKKIIKTPLFTSYVFVHINEKDQTKIRLIAGVINFVYWLGKPAVVQDNEIDIIKRFLQEFKNVKIEKVNDKVRIISGPLLFHEGVVEKVGNRTIKVYLPSLGFEIYAEVEKSGVELLN